ncbi:hypothetical protein ACE6H2_026949 [Prunus campanulata]
MGRKEEEEGDDVVSGTKRRNQSWRVGSTVTSEVVTPLTGAVGVAEDLKSMKLRRRRLMVPSARRAMSVIFDRTDNDKRVFHGREAHADAAVWEIELDDVVMDATKTNRSPMEGDFLLVLFFR